MDRRNFIKVGGALASGLGLGRLLPAQQTPQMPLMQSPAQNRNSGAPQAPADFTLKIAPVLVELAPYRSLSTIGYNGSSPGPLIRVREGKPITIDVVNDTDVPELVHWHGQLIPSEVDGAEEEGTPMFPRHGRYQYDFTPGPAAPGWKQPHTTSLPILVTSIYTA